MSRYAHYYYVYKMFTMYNFIREHRVNTVFIRVYRGHDSHDSSKRNLSSSSLTKIDVNFKKNKTFKSPNRFFSHSVDDNIPKVFCSPHVTASSKTRPEFTVPSPKHLDDEKISNKILPSICIINTINYSALKRYLISLVGRDFFKKY